MLTFNLSLDIPAEERWKEACSYEPFVEHYQYFIKILVGGLEDKGKRIAEAGDLLNSFFSPQYSQEINGCAKYLGILPGLLTWLNCKKKKLINFYFILFLFLFPLLVGYEISDAWLIFFIFKKNLFKIELFFIFQHFDRFIFYFLFFFFFFFCVFFFIFFLFLVAQDKEGNILHARNLDFGDGLSLTPTMKQVAAIFNVYQSGNFIYEFSTFIFFYYF
jgi:hypothetical protein